MYVSRRIILDARLFVAGVFCMLVVARVISLMVPSEFYFTFQSLFADRTPQNFVVALAGKMLAPFVSGFVFGWAIYRHTLSRHNGPKAFASRRRRLQLQWSPTMFLAGVFGAFLSAWPIIVYWDLLGNPEVAHLKLLFFGMYLIYMFAYGYIMLFGFLSALFVNENLDRTAKETKLVSIPELSRVGVLWLLSSGIASGAIKLMTK